MSINERVEVNKEFDSAYPLTAGAKAEVKVKMAGIVNRRIKIQIVEDVLVEGEPKETPAGKDGAV